MSLQENFENTKKEWTEAVNTRKKNMTKKMNEGIAVIKLWAKRLLIALLVAGVVTIGFYFLWSNYVYSEGTRAGTLIKISKKGYLFKTYEGQLKMGGIDLKNQDELSDTWSFSVRKQAIVDQLEELQGERVVLRYEEINYAMPWQGDTNYFIVEVKRQE